MRERMKKKVELITFGFKYGFPRCNHFTDISWVKNPFRHPKEDPYLVVMGTGGVGNMVQKLADYIESICGKDICKFGIGCSSGRDRSPLIANELKKILEKKGVEVTIRNEEA